jgi:flagellin-like protein
MFGRRGITPIIATILVVMMTVAAAGAMFFWLTKIQATGQGAVEESQTTLLERMSACATIPTFNYNNYDNKSNMDIQNCGNTMLTIGDGDDNALIASNSCSFNLDCDIIEGDCPLVIGPGGFKTAILNLEEANCGSNKTAADILADQEGLQHQFILTIGTSGSATTTTARSFVPRRNAPTPPAPGPVCGVTLTALIASPQVGPRPVCFPYDLNNTGGTIETYNVSVTSIAGPCNATLFSSSLGCTSGPNSTSFITVPIISGGFVTFGLDHYGSSGAGPCTVTIQAVSTTNSSCSDTDVTITNN